MTDDTARRLRDGWAKRPEAKPCQHFQLELVWTAAGTSMGIYACLHCGTEVCHCSGTQHTIPSRVGLPETTERWVKQEAERIIDKFLLIMVPMIC